MARRRSRRRRRTRSRKRTRKRSRLRRRRRKSANVNRSGRPSITTKRKVSTLKFLLSSAKDRKKRIDTVTSRLAAFIDDSDFETLKNIHFGKHNLFEKSGHFRGADGSHFFADYIKTQTRNKMKTGKDLENIMQKWCCS